MNRQLKSKIMEHKNHIQWNTSIRSIIIDHRLQEDHEFDWENIAILDEEFQYKKRLVSEMLHIRRQIHRFNLRTDMERFLKIYFSIIDKL